MKRRINLTEADLHRIVKRSVNKVLKENEGTSLSLQFEKVYQSIIDCDDLVNAFVNKNFASNETTDAKAFYKLANMVGQLHNYAHELEERLAWD